MKEKVEKLKVEEAVHEGLVEGVYRMKGGGVRSAEESRSVRIDRASAVD